MNGPVLKKQEIFSKLSNEKKSEFEWVYTKEKKLKNKRFELFLSVDFDNLPRMAGESDDDRLKWTLNFEKVPEQNSESDESSDDQ